MACIPEFDKAVKLGIKELSKHIQSDVQAKKYVYKAYVYENVIGNVYEPIKKSIKDTVDKSILEDDIIKCKIMFSCTTHIQVALEAAEWYYNQAKRNGYGTIDAGLISLAYFRIIELEFNICFTTPFINQIRIDDLENAYNHDTEGKSKNIIKKYENRWKNFIKEIKIIKDPDNNIHGFMLGMLSRLIRYMRNVTAEKYELEDMLFKTAMNILTPEGKKALLNGEMENVISSDNIEKYRNPPAHTRYLSYDIAKECRHYVLQNIEIINGWFCNIS